MQCCRHRWTGRYEAHLWDNSCRREGQARKGRQGLIFVSIYHAPSASNQKYLPKIFHNSLVKICVVHVGYLKPNIKEIHLIEFGSQTLSLIRSNAPLLIEFGVLCMVYGNSYCGVYLLEMHMKN